MLVSFVFTYLVNFFDVARSTVNGDTHGKELKIKKRKKGNMESQIISAMVENNELQTISKEYVVS